MSMPRRLAGKRLAGSGVLVSAFALAGCVMGPNYHVPEKAAASQAVAKAPFHEAPTTPDRKSTRLNSSHT